MAATDHTSRRTCQRRGRHRIRRRVGRQCGGRRGGLGSVIPHAGPIRALVIAMIQAAFRAGAMPAAGRAHRATTRGPAARRRAVGMPAIARRTDRERPAAAPTRLESQRGVHVVGPTTVLDWTARGNRVTNRRPARSVAASRRSPGAWRDQLQVLTSLVAADSLLHPDGAAVGGALGGRRRVGTGAVTTAAERLSARRRTAAHRRHDRNAQADVRPDLRASM